MMDGSELSTERFLKSINDSLGPNILQYKFLISFSGGLDSTVLAHLALQTIGKKNLEIIHFNHNKRNESQVEEENIRLKALEWAIPLKVIRLNFKGIENNFQNFARQQRQKHYQNWLQENPEGIILLGHHQQDNFESALFQILRGGSGRRFKGIEKYKHAILRPLLPFSKKKILLYAKKEKLTYFTDSSNFESQFMRTQMRQNVFRQFNVINPNGEQNFGVFINEHNEMLGQENKIDINKSLWGPLNSLPLNTTKKVWENWLLQQKIKSPRKAILHIEKNLISTKKTQKLSLEGRKFIIFKNHLFNGEQPANFMSSLDVQSFYATFTLQSHSIWSHWRHCLNGDYSGYWHIGTLKFFSRQAKTKALAAKILKRLKSHQIPQNIREQWPLIFNDLEPFDFENCIYPNVEHPLQDSLLKTPQLFKTKDF